jgi:hypothetical protein
MNQITKDEALKLALEALENTTPTGFNMERDKQFFEAITALREALAEKPAQQDIPDLIAGALGVSRGTAYDMMREALKEASPVQEPMHPELKKMYEDYFDKCFREFSSPEKGQP